MKLAFASSSPSFLHLMLFLNKKIMNPLFISFLVFLFVVTIDSFATSPKIIHDRQVVQLNLPLKAKEHLKNVADQYQPSPQEEIEEECIKTMKFFNPFAIVDMEWKVTSDKKKQLAYYIYHLELIPHEVSFMTGIWCSLYENA